jgi:hypothetical protein
MKEDFFTIKVISLVKKSFPLTRKAVPLKSLIRTNGGMTALTQPLMAVILISIDLFSNNSKTSKKRSHVGQECTSTVKIVNSQTTAQKSKIVT